MDKAKNINPNFKSGLKRLGFSIGDNSFFFSDALSSNTDPQAFFHIEKSKLDFSATAVYLRKQLNGSYKPQVYLYDYTDRDFNSQDQQDLVLIQKKIWSSGEAPLACIFYKTEIKILNCSTHLNNKDYYSPEHLVKDLKIVGESKQQHKLFNESFALKIKSGVFWDEDENRNRFKFQNSAYDKLIGNIRYIVEEFRKKNSRVSVALINKIIVQSILIRYLEERTDNNDNKLLTRKYFQQFGGANTFIEVIRNNKFVELLNSLNKDFNGNVFKWSEKEQSALKDLELYRLADLLDTRITERFSSKQFEIKFLDWEYFEFKYIPVELISRLYEEFIGTDKKKKGLYYTPSHLAQLLIDESIPLSKFNEIDPYSFKIFDPSCGSGIFLVTALKRLVQIWRLRNNSDQPDQVVLKKIIQNIYGIDIEEQAIQLTSFSLVLAFCDSVKDLSVKIRFDDLTTSNLIQSDFFASHILQYKKFDLVIGNPPFQRGGTKNFADNKSKINDNVVTIPNNQIALKFLADSYGYLNKFGLLCMLVKSSALLYNTSSSTYLNTLLSQTNVIQILDFTGLARNKALWDNKKGVKKILDVDTSAIFIRNDEIDLNKNILHLTFRRTKATSERIIFEIDDYDLHFINRNKALSDPYIWKKNLLGGGRIGNTVDKLSSISKLNDYVNNLNTHLVCSEGVGGAKSFKNEAYKENGIDKKYLTESYLKSFKDKKDKKVFSAPVLLIKKNIDLPYSFSKENIKFSNETIGFHSKDEDAIKQIFNYVKSNHFILKFYNICTSGKMLVYKNTACKKEDILNLPFNLKLSKYLSAVDKNIIADINNIMQMFLRNGENSKAVKPINNNEKEIFLSNYGQEFSSVLNIIYKNAKNNFRLSDVVSLRNSFIATIFKYDSITKSPDFHKDNSKLNLHALTDFEISKQLTVNRIIKLYPAKDTIVFIKPNQYRYWLSLIAYRDADKCVSDLSKLGY